MNFHSGKSAFATYYKRTRLPAKRSLSSGSLPHATIQIGYISNTSRCVYQRHAGEFQVIAKMSPTLEQLENDFWPDLEVQTGLVETCHRLRKTSVDALSSGDIRILLGQQIGVPHLVPIAIEMLDNDPMLNATFYSGDLLTTVLRANRNRYRDVPEIRAKLVSIALRARWAVNESMEIPNSLRELIELQPEYER